MNSSPEQQLFEVAAGQRGYFTAKQAVAAGYRSTNHPYHVKRGNWLKAWRGIYRLRHFPSHAYDQYMLWSLWSCNRQGEAQGVYSFDTALSLYEVSDLMPAKLHMTVPTTFRRRSVIPPVLILHRAALSVQDYHIREGVFVTTPIKTMQDIIAQDQIEDHLVRQAAREFTRRGLITRKQILALIEIMPRAARFFLEKRVGEHGRCRIVSR